ncbi:MAG TPA: MBL fold metallo-hydrolase [Phenylobacterium sp.]|uniref:MBL fold metallo-hydrolase n=1 Tax=Phenylobacterium sp. TaxID=1871053 RepID=UPI002B47F477|nr:MBL fold metallo-hydrolase [Phenylobacterium sp.]HKR88588.1 MBL fold metallo-hydrolase [Phenylobacterium sp.]
MRLAGAALMGVGIAAPPGVGAAEAADAPSGAGTRLILLGTAGGPIIRAFRSEPANLLVVDGEPYLIDAGYGCLRQMVTAGFDPERLAAVFITHHHLDHDADLADVISYNWVSRRTRKLPIIGPYGTEAMTKAAFDYLSVGERVFDASVPNNGPSSFVVSKDITGEGEIYKDERVRVTAAENTHYRLLKPGPDKSYAYRFDTAERSVVFTGDTGESGAIVRLAKQADILVSEVIDARAIMEELHLRNPTMPETMRKSLSEFMEKAHLPAEALGKMAAAADVKMVVLTHIVPGGADSTFDAHPLIAAVKRYYNGPVIAGRDLLEI